MDVLLHPNFLFSGHNQRVAWKILEGFSKVTEFARTQASLALDLSDSVRKPVNEAPIQLGDFEFVEDVQKKLEEAFSFDHPIVRNKPLSQSQWDALLDSSGRVIDVEKFQNLIFRGGIDPQLRVDVWPFLLGYYPFDSTYESRESLRKSHAQMYDTLKSQWTSISEDQMSRFSKFRERQHRIQKDVCTY